MREKLLSREQAIALCADYGTGEHTQEEMAEKFNISRPYVSRVGRGIFYKDIPRPYMQYKITDRRRRGSDHPKNNGLTEALVVEIRVRFAAGEHEKELGAYYHVHPSTISFIVRGHSWKHAGGPIAPQLNYVSGERQISHVLTEREVRQIYLRYWNDKERIIDLSKEYRVTEGNISHIVRDRKWVSITKPLRPLIQKSA